MKKRSKFSLSNYKIMSMNMGGLYPCGLLEVLPGDTIQQATNLLLRCSPLLAPVMHPVHVQVRHFYVPHRLVWEDFESFITGGEDGMDASVAPTITFASGVSVGTLGDYLGLPTGVNGLTVSALPFRGYALIFNEWFRDQDLISKLTISTASGADTTTSTALQNVAWEKDYFTSARPWPQKGPSITIPIGTTAPVSGLSVSTGATTALGGQPLQGAWPAGTTSMSNVANVFAGSKSAIGTAAATAFNATNSNVVVDLSSASAITVTALREALAMQRYEETMARWGSRYVEWLRSRGIRSSDARLQRPEFLGGGRQTIQFSEVLQTAEGTDPVGSLKGHGIAAMRSNRYRRFFEEHGYVFSFISVKPRTMYVQGLPRTWSRATKEEYWTKELEHIGQQEVYNKELYAAHATPNGIFGYQDRYDEYRRQESTIAGEFRSASLDYWHMARIFASDPALNADFVKSVPTERVFAVPASDVLYVMANHSIQARRLLSKTGTSFIM